MFGSIGGPEMILIFIVGLVVFGPRKLPELGKSLGKMVADFKRASSDFQRTVEEEVETESLKQHLSLTDAAAPAAFTEAAAPVIREAEGAIPSSALSPNPAAPAEGHTSAAQDSSSS